MMKNIWSLANLALYRGTFLLNDDIFSRWAPSGPRRHVIQILSSSAEALEMVQSMVWRVVARGTKDLNLVD